MRCGTSSEQVRGFGERSPTKFVLGVGGVALTIKSQNWYLKPEMIGTTIGAGDGASCNNLGVDQRSMQQNVITDQIYGHT